MTNDYNECSAFFAKPPTKKNVVWSNKRPSHASLKRKDEREVALVKLHHPKARHLSSQEAISLSRGLGRRRSMPAVNTVSETTQDIWKVNKYYPPGN